MTELSPLEIEIRRRIGAAGPMPVGEYMALCLGDPQHGYYMTRDPLGARGDFITAPEISQMFGELIGLWMAAAWKQMGAPDRIRIVEFGPGRGTLMNDALRAAQAMPGFRDALTLHLVEISPVLRAQQERTLAALPLSVSWHAALEEVPNGPAIVVANEFFDALPINQAVKIDGGWHERRIGIDANNHLVFTRAREPLPRFEQLLPPAVREAPEPSIFEWRADTAAMELGRRLANDGGVALAIDYGHAESATGETLQAVGQHAYANALASPGGLDLTAHVDFQALARAVEAMGAKAFGPIEQADFLRRLGIETRAASLKAKATARAAADIDSALARLIGRGRGGMGALFKAAAFTHPSLGVPPGFER
ncbi:MAG: SAM-dependent methyltransferase [Rhizobiales bacterium]|nr:SAM-dependent methyltransferase [Hyphomicrobiales bacterium]